uniref:Uncharacterized protein n=1 Tax=Anguilla anguilla TaxID=7936 RepID=A0A0E9R410_ANGAN
MSHLFTTIPTHFLKRHKRSKNRLWKALRVTLAGRCG